jgi:hypothetical protein
VSYILALSKVIKTNGRVGMRWGLTPLEDKIYSIFLRNQNQPKKRRAAITRQKLAISLFYAIGSIANALQNLRCKGIVYYNKITKTWVLTIVNQPQLDSYDYYIKLKQDTAIDKKENHIRLYGYSHWIALIRNLNLIN